MAENLTVCGILKVISTLMEGNFKTPQNCQSAFFFDLIKGAFFRLRIKLRRDKRLLPFPLRIKLRRDKPGSSPCHGIALATPDQTPLYSSLRMASLHFLNVFFNYLY